MDTCAEKGRSDSPKPRGGGGFLEFPQGDPGIPPPGACGEPCSAALPPIRPSRKLVSLILSGVILLGYSLPVHGHLLYFDSYVYVASYIYVASYVYVASPPREPRARPAGARAVHKQPLACIKRHISHAHDPFSPPSGHGFAKGTPGSKGGPPAGGLRGPPLSLEVLYI